MSDSANILLVNHTARISGAEQGLLQLAGHLDSARFSPTVLLPGPGELYEALNELNVPVEFLPLKRIKKTICPLSLASYMVSLCRVQQQLVRLIKTRSIHLIHANSNTAHVYTGGAASRAGIPCLWHSRDLVNLGPLGRRMASRATKIVATSRAVAEHLHSCRPAPDSVVTIHNAVDLDTFSPNNRRGKVRAALGFNAETILIATIGQLVPWKRHADFIEASALVTAEIPNARFLVVGSDLFDDDPQYVADLKRLAGQQGLAEKLRFTGHRSDMPAVLEAIDIVIHPAVREPFGRAVAEAMAMARPVIAVNACGPAELIENDTTGVLVPPESPQDLAAAAIALARNPNKAQSLGAAARKHIENNFALPTFIEHIESLYETLAPPAPAHSP